MSKCNSVILSWFFQNETTGFSRRNLKLLFCSAHVGESFDINRFPEPSYVFLYFESFQRNISKQKEYMRNLLFVWTLRKNASRFFLTSSDWSSKFTFFPSQTMFYSAIGKINWLDINKGCNWFLGLKFIFINYSKFYRGKTCFLPLLTVTLFAPHSCLLKLFTIDIQILKHFWTTHLQFAGFPSPVTVILSCFPILIGTK